MSDLQGWETSEQVIPVKADVQKNCSESPDSGSYDPAGVTNRLSERPQVVEYRIILSRTILLIVSLFSSAGSQADLLWRPCAEEAQLCENLDPYFTLADAVRSRKSVSASHDAVVMYSSARDEFGVFVVNRESRKHILTVAILPSHRKSDYVYDIEEADSSSLVVKGFGTTYGDSVVRTKYFIDVDAGKVVAEFAKKDIFIEHIGFGEGAVLLAGNIGDNRGAIVKLVRDAGYELITAVGGRPLEPILAMRRHGTAWHFLSPNHHYVFSSGGWTVGRHEDARNSFYQANLVQSLWFPILPENYRYVFSSGGWWEVERDKKVRNYLYQNPLGESLGFPNLGIQIQPAELHRYLITEQGLHGTFVRYLVWNDHISGSSGGGEPGSGIYESRAGTVRFHPLPQPPFELFAKYRPERVKQGYTKGHTRIDNQIGPWQQVGNKILFGLQFYDGEGTNGLGGYGQFDVETKEYELNYLPEIAGWSVSGLLVDGDLLWMGLSRQTEGFHPGNGLVAYNRKSGQMVAYPTPGIVNVIRKWRDRIYVGTTQGAAIISEGTVTALTLDIGKNGRNFLAVTRNGQ